jgi:hypothetical protein
MKRITYVISFFFLGLFMDCQKKHIPVLMTSPMQDITEESATAGGSVINDGGGDILEEGICFCTGATPTVDNTRVKGLSSGKDFTCGMTGLTVNTVYNVRAYAINKSGPGYGDMVTFTAKAVIVKAPCSPAKNSFTFNTITDNYYTSSGVNGIGNYEMTGNGNNSDLRIEFMEAPKTGKYITNGFPSFSNTTECCVEGVFGGLFSYYYLADARDTVYVTKLGKDRYSMDFCHLHFGSASTSYTFYSDGNLTTH